jgi:HPt (histidine-containing phosphotransfer) domain-containing protein
MVGSMRDAVLDRDGADDAMFKEILQSFVEPSEGIVADLIAVHNAHSAADVKAETHKLKSSSRSIGANELADTCLALETASASERPYKRGCTFFRSVWRIHSTL